MAQKGISTSDGIRITLDLTREELAHLLGTTIETVSRRLNALQAEGVIKLQGHRAIFITDSEKLSGLVGYLGGESSAISRKLLCWPVSMGTGTRRGVPYTKAEHAGPTGRGGPPRPPENITCRFLCGYSLCACPAPLSQAVCRSRPLWPPVVLVLFCQA